MPVTGRKPKPDGQKRNRVKPTYEWTEFLDVPYDGDHPEADLSWPTATREWWAALVQMPHCRGWKPTDWLFALDTARILAAFHAGDLKLAGELRARDKILGTTADARRDLRIRYVSPDAEGSEGSVTDLADYRGMVGA